jgi:type VI secretion system protein ImpC
MSYPRPDADTPFRILVLGDFGARASSGRPIAIDRDNFDQVMSRLDIQAELPGAGALRFKQLDDFHPDRLFQSIDIFRDLRALRSDIQNPDKSRQVVSELLGAAPAPEPAFVRNVPPPAADLLSSGGSLLDEIVETSTGAAPAAAPQRRPDPLRSYVRDVVAPYLVPNTDAQVADMVGQVDAAVAAQMRAILHHRRFQSLEAAWRGLDFLVRNIETGANLKIYVLHMPRKTLAADLIPANDLRHTALYRLIVEETVGTPGGHPWALVAANYAFGPATEDVELLGRMALLCAAARSPVIARADAALLGDARELAVWNELRTIPEAQYVGLALPGFLLRLPYGANTSPIDSFPFEETSGEPKRQDYVWGNPAFLCAYLIAEGFSDMGWDAQPGDALDISGLPAHVYESKGEQQMTPCAEVVMTESEASALMDRGLIPLLSIKNTDRVHVAGFRSITGKPLAGRWPH